MRLDSNIYDSLWLFLFNITLMIIVATECHSTQSLGVFHVKIRGRRLTGHIIKSLLVPNSFDCATQCFETMSCKSYNFQNLGSVINTAERKCELNSKKIVDENDNQLVVHNEFAHFQMKGNTSCSSIKANYPTATSGYYAIEPDGGMNRLSSEFTVYCDMTGRGGVGTTIISHDSETRTLVDGYEESGSYQKLVQYNGVNINQIKALIDLSSGCEQFVKLECTGTGFYFHYDHPVAYWVSRHGEMMKYWGGAAPGSGKCACGMTNTCVGGTTCNCDSSGSSWLEDSGMLTDLDNLPVTELRFGDTGYYTEKGYHTLGKLNCWGGDTED